MPYVPKPPPSDPHAGGNEFVREHRLDELAEFIENELRAISLQFSEALELELRTTYFEPKKPRTGMIVHADGVSWDPGSGVGYYGYQGVAWLLLAGAAGGLTDGDKGDVTVSGAGTIWTIDAGVVTLAKMANIATASFLGRTTAGAGIVEVLTVASAKILLAITEADVAGLIADLAAKQPLDSDLTTIAGLVATTDNFIQSKAGAWSSRTIAQVKPDLGLTGVNSGDQTSIVGITGTKAQFNTAATDGDFLYVGDIIGITDGDKGDIVVSVGGTVWRKSVV